MKMNTINKARNSQKKDKAKYSNRKIMLKKIVGLVSKMKVMFQIKQRKQASKMIVK
jgi:hypothetical protein